MQSSPPLELMERDSIRKQRFCSLNLSKQRNQDAPLQEQECVLNMEASLNQYDRDNMASGSTSQGSMKDVLGMDIAKQRDESSFADSSNNEPQVLCDASKGLGPSAFKGSLLVVEAVTQGSQLSKFGTLGKMLKGEKTATCVHQSKKGATQSGILDFLTVQGKKQDFKQDKLTSGSLKDTTMWEAKLPINTRFSAKEGTSIASSLNLHSTNFECEDFFLPASKKCRLQKRQEAADVSITECTRTSKRDSLDLRRCVPNDVKVAEAMGRNNSIILKKTPRNEDFFKPASEKQKQMVNKEVIMKLESLTKAKIRDEKYFEFDLQTEAKLAAEENAQLWAGKPTHPFFSQCKIGPQAQTFWNAPFLPAAFGSEVDILSPAPPFHVNQIDKECETGSQTVSFAPNFFETKMDQPVLRAGFLTKCMEELGNLLKRSFLGELCKVTRLKSLCADHDKECLEVCLDSTFSCTASSSTSRNLLWTDAYQPQLLEQVYGNKESIKCLSEWLQNWQIRCTSWAGCSEGDTFCRTSPSGMESDEDKGWSEEDSNGGLNSSNDYSLPNVLVLAGPVGCGKTAAVYACAKAHGYAVIEFLSGQLFG